MSAPAPVVSLGAFGIESLRVRFHQEPHGPLVQIRVTLIAAEDARHERPGPFSATTTTAVPVSEVTPWLIRETCLRALEHELDEWLRINGARVTGHAPHAGDDGEG